MNILIPAIISFFITIVILPYWIKIARKHNLLSIDVHKPGIKVAELGGLLVVFGAIIGILFYVAWNTFSQLASDSNFMFIMASIVSILIAAFIGLVDDILGWKIGLRQYQKAFLSVLIAVPLVVVNAGVSKITLPFFGEISLGLFYPLLAVPIGIVGASNAFNMLAGFNGLEAGMGIIILSTLGYLAYAGGQVHAVLIAFCFVAALLAFLFFNWYPAKIFGGNILTYSIGTVIAIVTILGNNERAALILFIPYFIEFLLKMRGLLQKESFGKPLKDGSITNRYDKWYGLEHVAISSIKAIKKRAYEWEVVIALYEFELIFVGFIVLMYAYFGKIFI